MIETVPREVVKQDFYAVEHRVQYYKEIVPEKKIEMVPVEGRLSGMSMCLSRGKNASI